jgi:dipeptidyl-peptidase-4
VRGGELYRLDLSRGRERRLTRGASEWVAHGLAEFVAQEEMGRHRGFWWSPDSRLLAYEEADSTGVEKLTIADPMRPELPAERFAYPRAGQANAAVRLGVVPAAGGRTRWIAWDREAYPYLASVTWEEGGPLALLVQNRAQTEEALLAANPRTGRTRTLLAERDPAWLDLHPGVPRWLEDGSGFLWITERNGGPELELRGPDGSRRETWVPPSARLVELVGVDRARRTFFFTACGGDPSSERLFRAPFGGPPAEVPIGEDGPANLSAELSRDGSALLVASATVRHLSRTAVLAPDGARLAALPSVAVEPPIASTAEVRRVGAAPGLLATAVRPRGMRPGEKLPVLVSVYGGPVSASWPPMGASRSMRLLDQWLADQGYLVVAADGRGTPRRGRDFERALRGDFAGANLDDQVEALRALAAEVPEMDLSRVGIYGWSFGGYLSAMAVMKRPDVFRAAVAGAPVAEWRDYDTHYTERYLGLPQEQPEAYRRSSLLTHAAGLERPLLVVHGTADDNVHFRHSLELSDALFRAGRAHGFLPLPGLTHMVPEPVVVERLWERIAAFFRESLGAGP